jgi:hypothetical protein
MALSQAEIKQILDAIKAESQDVTALDVATSLNNITSLPAIQAAKMVLAPLALLSKPAQDAAAIANNAAASANTAASNANTAATNANAMATSLETYGTDVAAIRAAITSLRDDLTRVEADLNALDHDNATEAIESFREILAFLDGCKDDETLLAKLTEIKALITAEAADRQSAIAQALNTAQVADTELQEQIAEHRRELHYLPDNFATEKALFTAAGTYTIGTQPIKPGALLLGCVDECWGVYQYVYFDDEVEVSAQSEEAVQAASAAAPTVAPPAVKHDANVANPEHWVRLATIEDVAALKKLVPVVEITAEEIAALLPADESQIATLELDAEDDVAGADQPATCDALERFRTRLREMRGRSVFKPKEVYNPNDYINYEHE